MAGMGLLPWQVDVLRDWSAHDARGQFVHRRCGASIPRQAGKSVDGIAWVTFLAAVLGYSVLWTDHNYSTTCEMLRRFKDIFGSKARDPHAKRPDFNGLVDCVNNKTAQESIHLKNGGLICFSTRTKSAALGYSFDVVVYDEAQELTGEQMQAILPTTTSGPHGNMQAVFLGTPTRSGSTAEVFQDIRDEAKEGRSDDLSWVEYGVGEIGDVSDESRWAEANPSLGSHASADAIRAASRTMKPLEFAQEYLGYWLPKVASAVLTRKQWEARVVGSGPESGVDAYGVKFSADGSTVALAAARRPADGPVHVELLLVDDASRGSALIADFLAERKGRSACALLDGKSGVGNLMAKLDGRVPKSYASVAKTDQAIAAASMMLDGVLNGGVTTNDSPALEASALSASRRKIGSGGGWGWGGDNSAPMEAASLAVYAASTTKRNPNRKMRVG